MNLDYAKAFANTSDLKQFTPKIDHNLAADRAEERLAEDGKEEELEIGAKKQSKT